MRIQGMKLSLLKDKAWHEWIFFSCYCRDPEKTKVVYIINTDLKGRLPLKLVNAAMPDLQLTFFKGLQKAVAEEIKAKS